MLNQRIRRSSVSLATAVLATALVWQTRPAIADDLAVPTTQPLDAGKVQMKALDKSAMPPHPRNGAPHAGSASSAPSKSKLLLVQGLLDARAGKKNVTTINSMLRMVISISHMVDEKPAAITKEPTYIGKPRYGAFTIGNGSKSVTCFAMDILPGGAIGKIYIDTNQNGDLTDDGSSDWDSHYAIKGVMHHEKTVTLHASWGSAVQETDSGEYTISLNSCDGLNDLAYTNSTARAGSIKLGDKLYPIVLGEGGNDGLFMVPADGERSRQYLAIYIDTDGGVPANGPKPEIDPTNRHLFKAYNIAHQIEVDGHWYMFRPSLSGAELTAYETTAPGDTPKPPAAVASLLPDGTPAPDFTVQTPDGKPLRLSDLKGKVVILDFWATWCGPCQQSMPGLEKIYQQVKDQNVVVLSVCVQDEKPAFDKWMGVHAGKDYNFTFAYDPAARGPDSVSTAKYNVHGIPTQFIIGPDGKIVASTTGYDESESKLFDSLKSLRIKVKTN